MAVSVAVTMLEDGPLTQFEEEARAKRIGESEGETSEEGMGAEQWEQGQSRADIAPQKNHSVFVFKLGSPGAGMNESGPFSTVLHFSPSHNIASKMWCSDFFFFDSFFICMVQYKDIKRRKRVHICHKDIIACKREVA